MPKASKAKAKTGSSSLTEHAAAERRYTKASLEHFQRLGWGEDADWKGKPHMEAEGYTPVKRKVIKGVSEYDSAKWGTPEFSARDLAVCMTKDVSKFFCLNEKEIIDLCFKKRIVITHNGDAHFAHDYSCSELERRAWEKYGGPKGLQMERKKRAEQAARKKAGKTGANQDAAAQQVQIKSISSYRRYLATTEPMVYATSEEHNVVPSVLRDDQPARSYSDPRLAFSAFSNKELGYANESNKPNGSEDSVDNYDDYGCGADCDCRTCNAVAWVFAGPVRRSDRSYAPVVAPLMLPQPPPLRRPPHKPQGIVVARPGTTSGVTVPAEEAKEESNEVEAMKKEREAKPDLSIPESKPIDTCNTTSSTSAEGGSPSTTVKQEANDQKPQAVNLQAVAPATPSTRRSSRSKAHAGVKRGAAGLDSEPGSDSDDGDFVPGRGR
ncbi:hypothetical protein CPC08DRAFT_769638 [Agrocybe pediades]|nr:hypothetical protein CPC08DRAFT_769638 [Agrocybe pediades]